jgi:ABC-2 type transport system ATP-binding protein
MVLVKQPPCGRIAGFEVQQQPLEVKRRVAYVPDDPPLFETLTVWEHILFIASAYGVNNYLETGELLLQQFELTNKRNALASELSRGMRQKVAIACAYLHQPEVMLFDEPLTGLDPAAIRMLKESMRQKAAGGATVLVSSHLLALVEDICEYLIVFQNGKCLFSGTLPEARQAHPEAVSLEDVFFRFTESKSVKETSDAPK